VNPELIREVRRRSSQTNLQAQRIVEELKRITSKPPPDDDGGNGEAEP
jgi:hypothetical protein